MEHIAEWGKRLEAATDWVFEEPVRMGVFTAVLLMPLLVVALRAHGRSRREASQEKDDQRKRRVRAALWLGVLMAGAIVGAGWYMVRG